MSITIAIRRLDNPSARNFLLARLHHMKEVFDVAESERFG